MNMIRSVATATGLAAALCATACTAERADENADAPSIASETLDERDEGTTYNGWSQYAFGQWELYSSVFYVASWLNRSSGDATRGGGTCFVRRTGTGCSSDATCTSLAQSTYGASAYGYCYSGVCYNRPGSQASYCALNPNRAPGFIQVDPPRSAVATDGNDYALGCMTKTAGPNTACGGTNGSLYMRMVDPVLIVTNPN
jgi:hypothetical protein